MKKINIFIHTYKVNDWKLIRDEQLEYINNSGLGDVSDVHICHYDNELKTQLDMWKHSKSNDSYYLYLHNLGITWQGTKYEKITEKYRRWCLDGVVKNWKEYVLHLDEYDAVGDDWKDAAYYRDWHRNKRKYKDSDLTYPQHFATQMWWTKSSHLSKLENPLKHQKYFRPEHGNPRVIMEGWLTSLGKNFKEIRNDFTREPLDAYNHQHLKNMP